MNDAMMGAWAAGDIPLLWSLSLRIARAYWRQRLRADGVVMAEAESRFGLVFSERIGRFPEFRSPEAVIKSWARSTGLNARRGELRRKRREIDYASLRGLDDDEFDDLDFFGKTIVSVIASCCWYRLKYGCRSRMKVKPIDLDLYELM